MINVAKSASLLAAIVLSAATSAERVAIPAPHLGEGKTLQAQLFLPAGRVAPASASGAVLPERLPAVILLHGCGGIGARGELNPRHAMWKDWFVERGFVVLFPESFSSRGYTQICTQKYGDRSIKQADRVDDVLAAKRWLTARSDIDASKLVLMGWSHGGSSTLATITKRVGNALDPDASFAQAISFYPGCSSFANSSRLAKLASPLALFIGADDDWTPAAPCERWVARLREEKQPATITTYPGAFHDFDAPNIQPRVRRDVPNGVNPGKGVTVAPDPLARELVKKEVELLLAQKNLIARKR